MKYKILILPLIFLAFAFQACDDMLDIAPENILVEDKIFESEGSAESAMAGLYYKLIQVNNVSGSGGLAYSLGDLTDDMVIYDESSSNVMFSTGEIPTDDAVIEGIWTTYYDAINIANIFVVKAPKIAKYSKETLNRHIAEAKFVRAYCYFNLLRYFGDGALNGNEEGLCVPLQLEPYEGKDVDKFIPRNTNKEVYTQILKDINESLEEDALPESYDSDLRTACKATKYAAYALKARVEMSLKNYDEVIKAADEVIKSTNYELDDLAEVFPSREEFSKDHIWGYDVFHNGKTAEQGTNIGNNGLVSYSSTSFYFSKAFVSEYADGDLRKENWYLEKYDTKLKENYHTLKYYHEPVEGEAGRYNIDYMDNVTILRYAEVLMNKAEALAATSGVTKEAVDLLNSVRERAGLTGDNLYELADFSSKEDLLEAIWKERKLEFAGEGHQRYDLIRTGRDKLPQGKKCLPIPQNEIVRTEGVLVQTPAFK